MALSPAVLRISDPEELPRTAAALERHRDGLVRVHQGARAASRRIEAQARDAVVQLEGRCLAARLRRDATDPEDRARYKAAEDALLAAQRAETEARRQRTRVQRTLGELERTLAQQARHAEDLAEQGDRGLRRFWEQLGRASSSFASAVARHRAPSSVADPRRITAGGGASRRGALDRLVEKVIDEVEDEIEDEIVDHVRDAVDDDLRRKYPRIGDNGRVLVPLDDLVDPDPVTGPADFLKVSVRDMQQGLRLLEERILPAMQRGLGRDEMVRLDEQGGTVGSPTGFVAVYEAFFGGEERAVRVVPRPDGRLEVVAGRHRVWVAQRLHLDALPVLVRGGS